MFKRILATGIMAIALSLSLTNVSYGAEEEPQDTYIEKEYQDICIAEGERTGICPELIMALIEKESRGKAKITCKDGCHIGLCQLSQKYFGGDGSDLTDPQTNISKAADYLQGLFDEYEDVGIVLGKYHGESNAVKKAQEGKLSSYTKWILARSEELERLHGK